MCIRNKDSFKTVRDIDELNFKVPEVKFLEGKKIGHIYTSKHLFTTVFPEKQFSFIHVPQYPLH